LQGPIAAVFISRKFKTGRVWPGGRVQTYGLELQGEIILGKAGKGLALKGGLPWIVPGAILVEEEKDFRKVAEFVANLFGETLEWSL